MDVIKNDNLKEDDYFMWMARIKANNEIYLDHLN
jgi:hypothetical protein